MDLNRLTRDADEQIRKVVARYNQLYIPTGAISQVELDLLLDELRKLYDTFKGISHLNQTRLQHISKPDVKVQSSPDAPAQVTPAPATEPATFMQPKPEIEARQPEPTQPPEPKQEPEPVKNVVNEIIEDIPSETHPQPQTVTEAQPERQEPVENFKSHLPDSIKPEEENADLKAKYGQPQAMLADTFSQGSKSVRDNISAEPEHQALGARIGFHPITDLSTGIGINDRFIFISDLFENNNGQYQEAITRINKAVNLDEANWIFQKYRNSAWNQKQDSVDKMKDFIKRRFI